MQTGGACFVAVLHAQGLQPSFAPVVDFGNGHYEVSYVTTKAGPFALELSVEGQEGAPVLLIGQCVPGLVVGAHWEVQAFPPEPLSAGQPVSVCVSLSWHDVYGNRVAGCGEGVPPITARNATGSPPLLLEVQQRGGGAAWLSFTPTAAGSYTLELACGGWGGGSYAPPCMLYFQVVPGAAMAGNCTVRDQRSCLGKPVVL